MNAELGILPLMVSRAETPRGYRYRHTVSFEETNLIGNVYFTRYVSWQGRCRELFLREYAPDIINELSRDLRLVTLRASCEYFAELLAFDDVDIYMSLVDARHHLIALNFNYFSQRRGGSELVARGFQEIGCMRRRNVSELVRCGSTGAISGGAGPVPLKL
jgi:enediyne biosynthesis thioesterase